MLPRPLVRLALLLLAAAALSGCPSLTERAGLPPSVDRAETLERSGDAAGAAGVYEQLAAQNSGADRNDLLLRAARAWLAARRPEDAARVLAGTASPLPPEQGTERALLGAELALERGQAQAALQQLAGVAAPRSAAQAARYRDLQTRAAALAAAQHPGPAGLEPRAAHCAAAAGHGSRCRCRHQRARWLHDCVFPGPAGAAPARAGLRHRHRECRAGARCGEPAGRGFHRRPADARGGYRRGGLCRRARAAPGAELPAAGAAGTGAVLPVRPVARGRGAARSAAGARGSSSARRGAGALGRLGCARARRFPPGAASVAAAT